MEIDNILERATSLEQRYLSVKAVLEERGRRKEELEKECLEKGYDPNSLEEEIEKLEKKRDEISSQLREKLDALEDELKKYES